MGITMPQTRRPYNPLMRTALLTTTTIERTLPLMHLLSCAVHDWFAPCDTTATLAAWKPSWWLIVSLLCGVVVLIVAWLLVWHGADETGVDER